MLKRILATIAVALTLASCGSSGNLGGSLGTSDPNALAKSMISACEGAAAAENTIASFIRSGHIKPVSFPAIDQARVPIRAFCDPSAAIPEDVLTASRLVINATMAMLALKPKQ